MGAELDLSGVDPAGFAAAIANTPRDQLIEGMRSEARTQILDEIFGRMKDHAVAERIATVDAVVHFEIGGGAEEAGPDFYEIVIRNGAFDVNRDATEAARVTMTIDGADFLRLASGNANGAELFMQGLLRLDGDILFATQVAGFFEPPPRG
jgi:putative sterol carrier protein